MHDRFIPNRSAMNMDKAHHALCNNENSNPQALDTEGAGNGAQSEEACTIGKKGETQSPDLQESN